MGTSFLITWVRGNIEDSPHIPYPFNYGEDVFLSFSVDRRKHIMDPRQHNPVLTWNNLVFIEISGPPSLQVMNPLYLELHNLIVLLFWKLQTTCGNKLGTVAERKFRIRGLKNKVVLDLGTWSMLWLYFLKGWQSPPNLLLVEGGSIILQTTDWHPKLK